MATFTNTATLSYGGNVTNSNTVSGEVLSVLSATKTAVRSYYTASDSVTFVISIVNSGLPAFTGLTVTNNMGAYLFGTTTLYPLAYVAGSVQYFVNGVLQSAPTVTAGPPLQFTGVGVPANGTALLVYEAKVNQYAPLDLNSTITNSATITGGGLSTPVTAKAVIATEDRPDLTISKSISPVPVVENGQLTYTFVIQNSGNTATVLADKVVVKDVFSPILGSPAVTVNGATLDSTKYSYDAATGTFQTTSDAFTVPAAAYAQEPVDGYWIITPGVTVLKVVGTI